MIAFTLRIHRAKAFDGGHAAHPPADRRVENDRLEMFAAAEGAFIDPDGLEPVGNCRDFIAQGPEKLRGEFADRLFIIHHQDPLMIVVKRTTGSTRLRTSHSLLFRSRGR